MSEQKIYELYLSMIHGLGPVRTQFLREYFGSPKDIFDASEEELINLSDAAPDMLSRKMVQELLSLRDLPKLENILKKAREDGIEIIGYSDSKYPERLREIYSPPQALFVTGKLPKNNTPAVAVIGSRTCGSYGRDIAFEWSKAFAEAGIDVISGMAAGVDGHAHRGAIAAAKRMPDAEYGKTYAVLGCGPDICYPKTNIDVYMELAQYGGLISEFPPGSGPLAERFPQRNRIIAGLADIILVVEARIHSGTLITVSHALDQGKDVCCIPGRINDAASAGCNELIKTGARLVTGPWEIIEELREKYAQDKRGNTPEQNRGPIIKDGTLKIKNYSRAESEKKKIEQSLSGGEKIIYAVIGAEEKSPEEIIGASKMSAKEVMEHLISMEMKGLIRSYSGLYRRV